MPFIKKKESLNIIIIGPAHPLRGGLSSYNHRLAQEFILHGHQVKIHTFSLQYPGIFFPGKSQYSDDPAPRNIEIERSINSINPFSWIKVGRQIATEKPDIVLCMYWLPFMAPCFGTIARLSRKNKSSVILSIIHNLLPHEKRIGDRSLSKYFINSVDGFVAQSKSVLEDLASFGITKNTKLVPHPIYDNFGDQVSKSTAAQELGLDPDQTYILFFGFIRDYKGLDILLKAMADPELKNKNIKLIVAGEFYNNEEEHLALIKSLQIENNVILHTYFISNEKVKYYFGISDLVVQPYKSATQSGISQMAYHFEIPMVVTNVGGLAEIVPDGKAGYVTPVDPKAVADAIVNYFEKDKKKAFQQFIKIKKNEFSWENMMNAVTSLHQNLTQPKT